MSVFGHPDQDADVGVIERTLEQWKALCEYARIGVEKPPEHVFIAFQRLHGLPETGAPEGDDDPFAALARLATRLDEQEKALRELVELKDGGLRGTVAYNRRKPLAWEAARSALGTGAEG